MIILNCLKENWKVYNILLVMLFRNYILSSNFQKIKTAFILNSVYLCCKIDSDDTQTLINAKDWSGVLKVNEVVQNIFIECKKIFCSFTSAFCLVFKYSELVQEIQANSSIISNYDSLCYSIKPKVNKKLSLKLLENML